MNRTSWLLIAGTVAVMFRAIAMAQPTAEPAAPAALPDVQKTVTQVCAACHGSDGNSPSPANPTLAGQPADYITLQLAHFKSGIRTNPIMQAMAAPLTDAEMKALGIYFAHQKPKGSAAKDATLVKTGQSLYRGGDSTAAIPACAACHLPNGVGIPKNYPRLAGQYADYTYAQLKAFKAGERGNDQQGKDVNGKIMNAIAQNLTDVQMKALADYVAGLR